MQSLYFQNVINDFFSKTDWHEVTQLIEAKLVLELRSRECEAETLTPPMTNDKFGSMRPLSQVPSSKD